MIRGLFLPAVLLALLVPSTAGAATYAIDPVHTRIGFQVSHAGFSWPLGSFSGASGRLEFDPKDWQHAKVDVRFRVATLELGDAQWQKKILDRTFFDAEKFPEAHFVSTRVEPESAQLATVTGDLTLHGVTRPVTLKVRLNALARHPLSFRRTAGFSATGTLSRKDFGIDNWEKVVGDEVRLILEVEATRERGEGDGDDGDDD